jgi:hypothetical protein
VTRARGKGFDEDPARRAGGSGWVASLVPGVGGTAAEGETPGARAMFQRGAGGVR